MSAELQAAGWREHEVMELAPSQLLRRLAAARQVRAMRRAEWMHDYRAAKALTEAEALQDYIDKLEADPP